MKRQHNHKLFQLFSSFFIIVAIVFTFIEKAWANDSWDNPIQYQTFTDHDQNRSITVHLVRIDLKHPRIQVGVALPKGNSTNDKESVDTMARRDNALAAINGSFFQHGVDHIPSVVGLLMKNGQVMADSGHRRTSIGITPDKDVIVGIPEIVPGIYFPETGSFKKVYINQNRQARQTIVYTPQFGEYTHTNKWGREVVVINNQVVRYTYGNTKIPANGFVISVHGVGKEIAQKYPIGREIVLTEERYGEWQHVETVLTGAPHLVKTGKVYNTYHKEKLQASLKRPSARSAIGVTHNHQLLMINAIPNSKGGGITYTRLAQIMTRLGAYHAMGLDGGSSTSLFVSTQGKTYHRPVTNALIVKLK